MKKGDLVKMKYETWWKVRDRRKDYVDAYGLVYSTHARGVKVLLPDGKIKVGLIEEWEVVNEETSRV